MVSRETQQIMLEIFHRSMDSARAQTRLEVEANSVMKSMPFVERPLLMNLVCKGGPDPLSIVVS